MLLLITFYCLVAVLGLLTLWGFPVRPRDPANPCCGDVWQPIMFFAFVPSYCSCVLPPFIIIC